MDCVVRGREVFDLEASELRKVQERLDVSFQNVVELIFHSDQKVVLTGIGKTGIVAHKIAASLASTGTHAIFLNAAEAVHGDLGMVCKGDIVIAISNSGESSEVLSLMEPLRQVGCPIVAMTGNKTSRLAKNADFVLDIHVDSEACRIGLAPTTSTTAALVMGDALVVCLMEMRNFQPENFVLYHPGGALGRRLLTRVKDRMEKNVPFVHEATPFMDVMYEMTHKRLGITMVLSDAGVPVGVITDGDIRRAVQHFDDIKSVCAGQFMTKNFKRILPDTLVSEALEVMDIHKITTLAVVEDETPTARILGILSIHHVFDFRNDRL
ncbi:MAG: KpsF/GutQ family sugar-phosphate isomerase [Planctomycetia bacterium]|nr:KpsF/GutQ family sugar-phosphate isomerase [Planctomycetia bacterium]